MDGRRTHFVFEHKLFALEGARFALEGEGQGAVPMLHVPLGVDTGSIPLAVLGQAFAIDASSPDGRLLAILARGLSYVSEIRPGDSVPDELLDGSVSWRVEDRHRLRAKGRLMSHLVAWLADEKGIEADGGALEGFAANPDAVALIAPAAAALARKGAGGIRSAADSFERLDRLARELAYVEAMRERYLALSAIEPKTNHLIRRCRAHRTMKEELSRVRTLLLRPIEEFDALFDEAMGKPADIPLWLGSIEVQVSLVRDARDRLHARMLDWDPLISQWQDLEPVPGPASDAAVRELYRFLVAHYGSGKSW